ncbi:MAG: RNA polymerase factor sigma-54 [Pseudomonadota bacterium]
MGLSPKLVLRQSQSLLITPQLMQAIKLLQLSSLELSAYVEQELVQNPLLERQEGEAGTLDAGPSDAGPVSTDAVSDDGSAGNEPQNETADATESALADARPDWTSDQLETSVDDVAGNLDTSAESVFPEAVDAGPSLSTPVQGPTGVTGDGEHPNLEAYATKEATLQDHLTDQLNLAVKEQAERLIGVTLIDSIDENGYLQAECDAVADQLGVPLQIVTSLLERIHTFDPAGVGARSLTECLALQLAEKNRLDPAMRALLDNLPLAAKRDFAALKRVCGVDEEDLIDMLGEVRALDPKPGRRFVSSPIEAVVPDILVREEPGGNWGIELNPETMPRVLVNRTYYATINRATLSADEKTYLSEQLQSANWLVKSLDQRARTMVKVGKEIVRQQDGFFAYGIEHLKPLTLKQIADAIEMHESTVSRVTSNKYMATPRGVFELKYFFTSAIQSVDGGDAHAAEAVRQRIKKLIDAEDPKKVLSDDQLVKLLKEDGIDIARRTVAKYREGLRIASSVQRRREKRAALAV